MFFVHDKYNIIETLFTYQKREHQRTHRVTSIRRDVGGELHQSAQQPLELAMSGEDAANASRCTTAGTVCQCDAIALLVRPSIDSTRSLLELGLDRLRRQRAIVVRRPGATGRAFVFRSRAVCLFLLAESLVLLRRGRVRLWLNYFLPRGRRCCNEN